MPKLQKKQKNVCRNVSANSYHSSPAKVSRYISIPGRQLISECSIRKMSTREAKDCQRGRHPLCHDLSWIRELRRGIKDLSIQISRGQPFFFFYLLLHVSRDMTDWTARHNPREAKIKIDQVAVVDSVLVVLLVAPAAQQMLPPAPSSSLQHMPPTIS
jgi:hypothetical protein